MGLLEQYQKQSPESFHAQAHPQAFSSEAPKMIQRVMKYSGGLIKNEEQAQYVLYVLVALAVILSFFLLFGGSKNNTSPPKIMDDTFNQTNERTQH